MLTVMIDIGKEILKKSLNFNHNLVFLSSLVHFIIQNYTHEHLITILTIYRLSELVDVSRVAQVSHRQIKAIQQIEGVLSFINLVVPRNCLCKIIMEVGLPH